MSADRNAGVGMWGCSQIRCDGHTDGRRCYENQWGGFRKGIKDARRIAADLGWQVAVRTQYTQNGWDIRDYCHEHRKDKDVAASA